MDTPGAYETKATEAMFNVTLPDLAWKPQKAESGCRRSTAAPSSVLRFMKSTRATTPSFFGSRPRRPRLRKLLYNNTNAEGWAHTRSR